MMSYDLLIARLQLNGQLIEIPGLYIYTQNHVYRQGFILLKFDYYGDQCWSRKTID